MKYSSLECVQPFREVKALRARHPPAYMVLPYLCSLEGISLLQTPSGDVVCSRKLAGVAATLTGV